MAVTKVATLHAAPGSRNWVEKVHDDLEAAGKFADKLFAAGEAEFVRFEHRLYPGGGAGGRKGRGDTGPAPLGGPTLTNVSGGEGITVSTSTAGTATLQTAETKDGKDAKGATPDATKSEGAAPTA